jgi:hypothetical protein
MTFSFMINIPAFRARVSVVLGFSWQHLKDGTGRAIPIFHPRVWKA